MQLTRTSSKHASLSATRAALYQDAVANLAHLVAKEGGSAYGQIIGFDKEEY